MQKNLSRFLITLIISASSTGSYAVGEGLYMGIMGGFATNNGSDQQITSNGMTVTASPKKNQGGVRPFIGYRFNHWAGFEMGATYYSVVNYDTPDGVSSPSAGIATVDVVGVANVSIKDYFDVFAKVGGALIYQGTSRLIRPAPGESKYQTYMRPTFSVGVDYALTANWIASISATQVQTNATLNNVTLYALGFSYHFVTLYCGQFICDD